MHEPEPLKAPAGLVFLPAAVEELRAEGESQWRDLGALGLHCRVSAAATIASATATEKLLAVEAALASAAVAG